LALEVSTFSDVEIVAEEIRVRLLQGVNNFLARPDKKLSFVALGISILAGIKSASRSGRL